MNTNLSLSQDTKPKLQFFIDKVKKSLLVVFLFSMFFNMLMLITPLYSLQVLDRVIGSQNLNTLLMLSLIIGITYLGAYLMQIARSFTLIKIGDWLDTQITPLLFNKVVLSSVEKKTLNSGQVTQDFKVIKNFLSSHAINSIFDSPWVVPYLIVLYFIHPKMCLLAILGAVVIVILAVFNAFATRDLLKKSSQESRSSVNAMEMSSRNAQVVEAMGMINNLRHMWHVKNRSALATQCQASYRNGAISNVSSFIRSLLQMSVTALGAYLVITTQGEITTGHMIASSILVGKALGPFNNFVGLWQNISDAIRSYKSIESILNKADSKSESMPIELQKGHITVKEVYFAHDIKRNKYTLNDINFEVNPGEILVIIGNSGSGKSTIARLITGILKPNVGDVRIDNNDVYRWERLSFGKKIGYLSQEIELFYGSVAQNIARMQQDFDSAEVVKAAQKAGADTMISTLANGYDTEIGIAGSSLSGGQRQRVGLARAFFGSPKILVLDEPNANLDEHGENALKESLLQAREEGTSVVLISHRLSILSIADKILLLQPGGTVSAYGKSEDVIENIMNAQSK